MKRWIHFQCSACRYVFRKGSAQIGAKINHFDPNMPITIPFGLLAILMYTNIPPSEAARRLNSKIRWERMGYMSPSDWPNMKGRGPENFGKYF